jgi:pimeloyl-ACP methyl ester carboxylesterase
MKHSSKATDELYYETAGEGRSVVLLHPGFADSRIWDPQWPSYAERFRVVRCDMPGFGRSPIHSLPVRYARDVAALLDRLETEQAALVGCSLGGRVALELAIARPDLVGALVLAGAATPEALATAPEMAAYTRAVMEAIRNRDLEAAVEVNLRAWVDGRHRTPVQVDPELRAKIATMQRDAFVNTSEFAASWQEEMLISDLADRLAEISVPTLVLVGELDMDFLHDQARLFADLIPTAQLKTIPNTAHAPSIDRPLAFDQTVIPFLTSATTERL